MITTQEHQKIDPQQFEGLDTDALKRRINYDTSRFEQTKINLVRYEFDPAAGRDGFYTYYRIGAEWLDDRTTQSLIVTPKMPDIDFIEMFMTCLLTSEPADDFSSIYDIDFESRPIRSKALASILSPLLVIQYLMTLKHIIARGLRKGYVSRSENLTKVKGRIDLRRNERYNIFTGQRQRIFCNYEEYSVDIPENRLLKRALIVASDMISLMTDHSANAMLSAICNHCMSAFSEVSDTTDYRLPHVKSNKLFHGYTEALRYAMMILRRQDLTIGRSEYKQEDFVPVFRIDMSLLFEHYALARLRLAFGHKAIKYQVRGSNRFIADFLIASGPLKAIADTKYVDAGSGATVAKGDYIKQLSGYARDKRLLRELGIDCSDENTVPILPCILIYPTVEPNRLNSDALFCHPIRTALKFFTYSLSIPRIKRPRQPLQPPGQHS